MPSEKTIKIAYSQLTDKIYIVSTNGIKEDVTQNFLQVFLLWFHGTSEEMKEGQKWERSLRNPTTGEMRWKITLEKGKTGIDNFPTVEQNIRQNDALSKSQKNQP